MLLYKANECGEALRENIGARFFNLGFSCEWICNFIGTHSLLDSEVSAILLYLSVGLNPGSPGGIRVELQASGHGVSDIASWPINIK